MERLRLIVWMLCLYLAITSAASEEDKNSSTSSSSKESGEGGIKGFFKGVQKTGEKTVAAVATPIEKAVVSVALKDCDVLKSILGVGLDDLIDSEPDVTKLKLELWYNEKDKVVYNITEAGTRILQDPHFHRNQPVVIFLHGFLSSTESDAALMVTRALSKHEGDRVNVLALDSSSLIKFFYLRAATCITFIGQALGEVLLQFHKGGVKPSNIHVVGHSLGAQAAGAAGTQFKASSGSRIGRITGLDPAGPCFFREPSQLRLSREDADFVDVIHTDAGVLGIVDPVGHADFYPNKGEAQPGCALPPCSHSRAWQLFAESVERNTTLLASECPGWDSFVAGACDKDQVHLMGWRANKSARGNHYLRTRDEMPYGLGEEGIHSKKNKTGVIKKLFS